MGKVIFQDLVTHLGKEYVFDLNACGKNNMPEDVLINFAHDPFVRVLACGGDGTCGWIESSLDKVWDMVLGKNNLDEDTDSRCSRYLPLAIMPLGTGNDLSRQFGWGGRFQEKMRSPKMIAKIQNAQPAVLDRWQCVILPIQRLDDECRAWLPKMLGDEQEMTNEQQKTTRQSKMMATLFDDEDAVESDHDGSSDGECALQLTNFFDGVFCNYFSIGFDAAIAFAFHKEREEHPERFTSPLKNKVVYVEKAPVGLTSPLLRNKIRVMVRSKDGNEIKELKVPRDCRAMVSEVIRKWGLVRE